MGFPKDLPPGEHLVQCFRPFLHDLMARQLSQTTVRKHVNNLWVLGGEIIWVRLFCIDAKCEFPCTFRERGADSGIVRA